jgi:hypothetical protein
VCGCVGVGVVGVCVGGGVKVGEGEAHRQLCRAGKTNKQTNRQTEMCAYPPSPERYVLPFIGYGIVPSRGCV